MDDDKCESCNNKGYLEVTIDNNEIENQWCENCIIFTPDYDPPEIEG